MSIAANTDPRKMNGKSANLGDQLKHSLNNEIFVRTDDWGSVTYAETHAGAGIYLAEHQPQAGYILSLQTKVAKQAEELASHRQRTTGSAYFELLRNWWSQERNSGKYPGGALQAALALQARREVGSFKLRLTEKISTTRQRLEESLHDFVDAEIRQSSFNDEREWLLQEDNLILVVDPFRCVDSFRGSRLDDLDKGYIDHRIVREFLEDCESKKAAVLHFWWPTTATNPEDTRLLRKSQVKARELFCDWEAGSTQRRVREFANSKSNYSSILVGIGKGASLVETFPSKTKWRSSWLKGCVTESDKYAEVRREMTA